MPPPIVPPPTGVGNRLWEWIVTGPIGNWVRNSLAFWFSSTGARIVEIQQLVLLMWNNSAVIPLILFLILSPIWVLYIIGIIPDPIVRGFLALFRALGGDPAGAAVDLFQRIYRDNTLSAAAGALVEFVFNDITDTLGKRMGQTELSPHESGLVFAKKIAQLSLAQSFTSLYLGISIPWLGRILSGIYQGMYWALGLGFLGWQSMAPFLRVSVQEPQEKFLNKAYRPNWITPIQAFNLAATGQDSFENALAVARYAGIPESQAHKMLQGAFREISESDLWTLYEAGKIDPNELFVRLRRLGYRPEDIPLVIQANTFRPEKEPRQVALSTLRAALRKGLITPDRFREMAKRIPLSDEEINLLIAIETFQKEEEKRQATTSQIEAAFKAGVLMEPEARGYLKALRYEDEVIDLLIRTWREEIRPRPFLLNAGRLADAFEMGVITEGQFMEKLLALGWEPGDARLFIDTIKERLRRKELPGKTERVRRPTVAMVLTFMTQGIIDQAEATRLLQELGYDEQTVSRLIKSALMEPPRESRKLSVSQIIEAYRKGFLLREEAIDRLVALNYSREDAEIIVAMETDAVGASDLLIAFHNGLITLRELRAGLLAAGYPSAAVTAFLKAHVLPADATDTFLAWSKGAIPTETARRILAFLGYSQEDIDKWIPPEVAL